MELRSLDRQHRALLPRPGIYTLRDGQGEKHHGYNWMTDVSKALTDDADNLNIFSSLRSLARHIRQHRIKSP